MTRKHRQKHIPQRTCIVCKRKLSKRTLNRIVRSMNGVVYDPSGKIAGRGAYLCDDLACWLAAIEGPALKRALKTDLSLEERQALRTEMQRREHKSAPPALDA